MTRKILAYAWTTVAVSLALIPYAGPVYGACAAALGVWLLTSARRLRAEVTSGRVPRPMDLFHVTNSYLALLFVAVVVGVLLRP